MKQTIKYKLHPTEEQKKCLAEWCFFATKLYNTDNYLRRQAWEETGKIPNVYAQKKLIKENHWFKLLPSQTAQEVIFNLQRNYNSWFKLRKKDEKANPPMFRKKEMLSPITFYQQFKIKENKIRLSPSRKYKQENKIQSVEIDFANWKVENGKAKMCQIICNKGEWFAHIVYEIAEPEPQLNDKVMAIDLGIINIASCVTNEGFAEIHSGKGIIAVQHYFNSRKARVQAKLNKQFPNRHKSKTLNNLNRKQKRQINQMLHTASRKIINRAVEQDIKTIVVGDITDIRKNKNFGKKNNQKLHAWAFSKLTSQIEYKAALAGIRIAFVNERDTSKTCSCCGLIRKSNRKHRGLYICKQCGRVINADINGAINILKKYLQIFNLEDRSIGCVEQPLVSRSVNVIPR